MTIPFMHSDSRIYIAGHRGLVGSAIHRELLRQGYRNILIRTHQQLDLLDKSAMARREALETLTAITRRSQQNHIAEGITASLPEQQSVTS